MENKKPKVLFTFVEAGFGHIIPMTGISEAFEKKYGDKCEVIKSYVFRDSKNKPVVKMGEELYGSTKLAAKNYLFNRIEAFSYFFSTKFTHWFLDIHFKKGEELYMLELQELNPDMVVASYYLPTHITARANERGLTNALTVTYTPDPYVYPSWDRRCDLFLVNNSVAYDIATRKGFDKDKVAQVPFIYREVITSLKKTKEECRNDLGLNKDKFQVLFTSGAYGSKNTNKIVKAILKSGLNLELTVICGKNPKMEEDMKVLGQDKSDSVDFNIIGYTDKIAEYMKGADVVIGKSGMNTMMEALYLGTPMIINGQANRLEEIIGDYFIKGGMAVQEKNADKMVELLKKCINDKNYLQYCVDNFRKMDSERGAEIVADKMFELLKTRYPTLN